MIIEYSHSLLLFSSLSSDSSINGIFHTLYIHHADDRWFWLNTNNGNKNDEKEKQFCFGGVIMVKKNWEVKKTIRVQNWKNYNFVLAVVEFCADDDDDDDERCNFALLFFVWNVKCVETTTNNVWFY